MAPKHNLNNVANSYPFMVKLISSFSILNFQNGFSVNFFD